MALVPAQTRAGVRPPPRPRPPPRRRHRLALRSPSHKPRTLASTNTIQGGRVLMLLTGCEPPFHQRWFSHNGKYVAERFGTEPYRLRVWDLDRGDGFQIAANRNVRYIAFSHGRRTVAVAVDGAILVYDLV